MKIINTRVHGVLDYLVGILLISAPWLFGFNHQGTGTWVPVILGIGTIVYSLFTNYELGLFKGISMSTHLTLDFISGLFLAVSPWLLGFSHIVYAPHLVVGVAEMLVVLMSSSKPGALVTNNERYRVHK